MQNPEHGLNVNWDGDSLLLTLGVLWKKLLPVNCAIIVLAGRGKGPPGTLQTMPHAPSVAAKGIHHGK